ncbi:hypothetical protein SAMN05444166_5728 [Singulisphaera sp. GP187]|nr:hypothetical protein SAMN05444166_5728 [Singulisphaera sp. GP187]
MRPPRSNPSARVRMASAKLGARSVRWPDVLPLWTFRSPAFRLPLFWTTRANLPVVRISGIHSEVLPKVCGDLWVVSGSPRDECLTLPSEVAKGKWVSLARRVTAR